MDDTLLADTWHSRDLPLLAAIVRQRDAEPDGRACAASAGEIVGMDPADQERAVRALRAGGYVVDLPGPRRMSDGPLTKPLDFTADALRAVQMWPTPETALDRMIDALNAIAANTNEDPGARTNAAKFATWLKTSATTISLGVATAAINGRLPGQ